MTTAHNPNVLPADIPAPQDDGGARHLTGLKLPPVALAATDGSKVDVSKLAGRTLVYIYPRTGVPGETPPDGWDAIPGARGCTPQSCSFRDHFAELKQLGVSHLYGLSTQDSAYQREAAERLHLPFPVLSDFWPHGATAQAYGAFNEALGIANRSSYVLDANGVVREIVKSDQLGQAREYDAYKQALAKVA